MPDPDPTNRMTEKVELGQLRVTAHRPSRLGRLWDWLRSTILTRTVITVALGVAILVVLGVWLFSVL